MDDEAKWRRVGVMLREARGTMDVTKAAQVSGNSRQWWYDAERGLRPAKPEKLVKAIAAVGGDVAEILEVAGLDPAPYRSVIAGQEMHRAVDRLEDSVAGRDRTRDAQLTQLVADIGAELREIRREMRRLGDAYEQLATQPLAPRAPASPPGPGGFSVDRRAEPSRPQEGGRRP